MKSERLNELNAIIKKLQELVEKIAQEEIEPKRTYERLRYRVPLSYSLYKTSLDSDKIPPRYGRTYKSIAKDISAGGILFEAKEPLPVGAIIKLILEMTSLQKKIECLVRIVRIEEIREGGKYTGRYNIGVCFLDMSSADKAIIDKFVQEEHEIVDKRILW